MKKGIYVYFGTKNKRKTLNAKKLQNIIMSLGDDWEMSEIKNAIALARTNRISGIAFKNNKYIPVVKSNSSVKFKNQMLEENSKEFEIKVEKNKMEKIYFQELLV